MTKNSSKKIQDKEYIDNNVIFFNISKEKIKNIIIIVLICIITIGGSYLASELSYYKTNYADAIGTSIFNNITIDEYSSILKGDTISLIYIGRDTCEFSVAQDEVFKELADDYNMKINYLNLDLLSEDDIDTLYSSYTSFIEDGLSTPTIMLVQNKEVKMFKKGYTSKESLITLLKENNFLIG